MLLPPSWRLHDLTNMGPPSERQPHRQGPAIASASAGRRSKQHGFQV